MLVFQVTYRGLRHAVDHLMNELRLDEEVHKPLPAGPREPK
jgi:hypothetical protein